MCSSKDLKVRDETEQAGKVEVTLVNLPYDQYLFHPTFEILHVSHSYVFTKS